MGIAAFIRDQVFAPRLRTRGVLVVYDPDRRYRELCLSMAGGQVTVVDATEGSIESRALAMQALGAVAKTGPEHCELLIYVPTHPPLSEEAKQIDPFSPYGVCGGTFPDGDGDGFLALCLRARPDDATEIRRLFEQTPSPDFALIDNIGGGLKWPMLRTVLNVESTRDVFFGLLAPSPRQSDGLQGSDGWVAEARQMLDAALGLKLKTRGKTWPSIADELWRYVLFSEFAFDLPGLMPPALANVPRAPMAARELVYGLCDGLRADMRFRPTYVGRAESIEQELGLPALCADIEELGARETFPFEERSVLAKAVRALREDQLDVVRACLSRHRESVWADRGESRQQWDLLRAALDLIDACDEGIRLLADHAGSLDALIELYVVSLRCADQRQREFEQAAGDHVAPDGPMTEIIAQARRRYSALMGKMQPLFTRHLETTGWPPPGRLANADLFDRHVAPLLRESGRRVAYIMVDALRYELGVALLDQLGDGNAATIMPACAQLPTVTPVGMASLLPGAAAQLHLVQENGGIVPVLGGNRLTSVAQRMAVLRTRYGDRFAETTLRGFIDSKQPIAATVSLLVLRDNEIDAHLENNPETTLGLLQQTLKRLRIAVRKLNDAGFDDVLIATDHGFFLNAQAEAGDLCGKPAGAWIAVHDRSLLGEGAADGGNFAIPAERVGIRGDFRVFAGPRAMAPYRRGLLYFHGGASLQEAIVPVLTVRLKKTAQPGLAPPPAVTLSYRKGARKITTRLPVIEITADSADIFSQSAEFEIQLEAQDKKGNVVGEPRPGGSVNPATGTIALRPGRTEQVILRMTDFEGRFTVKALDPTTLRTYSMLELETDYAV